MAAAVREAYLSALKAVLLTIDGTGINRSTVTTVEKAGARGWEDVTATERGLSTGNAYIGIVPQRESFEDFPGRVEATWPIDLLAHITLEEADRNEDGVAAVMSDLTTDVRRVLYTDATLDVPGVIRTRLVSRLGSEGVPEAITEGIASFILGIAVLMEEDIDLA